MCSYHENKNVFVLKCKQDFNLNFALDQLCTYFQYHEKTFIFNVSRETIWTFIQTMNSD